MWTRLRNLGARLSMILRDTRGAFAMTNKQFVTPSFSPLPAVHAESEVTLVNSTLVGATVNTGIAGLKWARVRARVKTLGGQAAGETLRISMQGSTGASLATPTNIGQQLRTMETGDTEINFEFYCWSEAGFQSYALLFNSSGSARVPVLDVMVDAC